MPPLAPERLWAEIAIVGPEQFAADHGTAAIAGEFTPPDTIRLCRPIDGYRFASLSPQLPGEFKPEPGTYRVVARFWKTAGGDNLWANGVLTIRKLAPMDSLIQSLAPLWPWKTKTL